MGTGLRANPHLQSSAPQLSAVLGTTFWSAFFLFFPRLQFGTRLPRWCFGFFYMIFSPCLPYLNGWLGENIILAVVFAIFVHGNPLSIDTVCLLLPMLRPRGHREFLGQADLVFWLGWWCWFYAGSLKEMKWEEVKIWKHEVVLLQTPGICLLQNTHSHSKVMNLYN